MYRFVGRLLVAHFLFWILLAAGWWMGELSNRQIGIFAALWLVASLFVLAVPSTFFWATALVAMIDIALILQIFKRDIWVR